MSPKGKIKNVKFYDGEYQVEFTGTSYNVDANGTKITDILVTISNS